MYHLTTPQQNIWNLQKTFPETSISNLCGAVFWGRKMDVEIVRKALNKFIELQAGMRLQFEERNGETSQYTAEYTEQTFPYPSFDDHTSFERYAQKFALTPFQMKNSPMYRFVIFELNGTSGVLACLNHLIADAWTFSLLAKGVYNLCLEIENSNFQEHKTHDYVDYVEVEQEYLKSERCQKDMEYWTEVYAEKPDLCPIKLISTPVAMPTAPRFTTTLTSDQTAKINAFCAENSVSQAVLFETAVFVYLSKVNRENKRITIGVPVLNRKTRNDKSTVGMYISTTPLTIDISAVDSVSVLSERITDTHSQLFRHQRYPYNNILTEVRKKHQFEGNLYDVIVSFQNAKTEEDITTQWFSNGYSEIPFSLHIDNRDSADSYTLNVDYQTEVFRHEEEISVLVDRLMLIINQIIENQQITVGEINIIPEEEYQKVIFDFNDTAVEYPRDKCIHELFSEQAARTPEKIALVFEDKKFTYKQLDEMSNSLAHYLREEKEIKPNDIVPIITKRSWHIIVAMLGVLKAGGAYMPVDPTYPVDRIAFMLEEADAKVALTFGYEGNIDIDSIELETFDYSRESKPIENFNTPNDLCYLIFTSGSTGKPKGTMLTHGNVRNYSHNNNNNVVRKIIKESYDGILSVTNIVFDIFVTESILAVLNSLTIYFGSDEEVVSQEKIATLIQNNAIDVIQTTPTKMRGYLLDKNNLAYLRKLKTIILGGEALPTDLYEELSRYTEAEIYNIYGPAETTVWSTNSHVESVDITIGKPIANTQIYILDKNRKPLPIGVAGELCISGDGVGKGYLNRPELTAEKFIPNPFYDEKLNPTAGKIMYCTGDLARWREDGEIEYLGRIDTQVKIRGLRIELGEIESVMSVFEGIRLTAVTDKRDENNRQYLVGYYTAETEIDEKSLRKHLSFKLPKYMVPNYFVHLEEMPMTASGKTDRKNLPMPDFTASTNEYVAPETETEIKLCNLIALLFEVEKVGVTDDFFDIGGDSLKAIEYIAKAHNLGIEIDLQDVYDYPTVRELCEHFTHGSETEILYKQEDFEKYLELLRKNALNDNFVPEKKSLGNILLTGATGFLGAHVLDAFMCEEAGKIYCLVRGGTEKFVEMLHYYFGEQYDAEIGKRILPVIGDITNPHLSDNIPNDVQTIIHTAASVKHYGSYQYFHDINVQGTQNVIDYAKQNGAKLIHISTISVSGNSFADAFAVYRSEDEKYFDEQSLFIEQELDNVYVHSKFEAELAVLDAALDGLDAKIIRVGNLTNRASDFMFQPNYAQNAFLTRIKAALEFGKFPEYLMPLYAEFSPIDETAEGVIRIAQYAEEQNVFHLNSNRPIYFTRLLEVLKALEIPMEVVSGTEFGRLLQEYAKHSETEYIYEAFQNDMDENGNLVYDSNIRIINDFTVQFLKRIGFEWTQIDFEYIKGYVEYFRGLGYLEV